MSNGDVFDNLTDFFTIDNCLALLLMKQGEKPGVLIMSGDHRQKKKIRKICNVEDRHWRVYGSSIEKENLRRKIKKFLGFSSSDPFDTAGIFVARNQERFEILEDSSGDFYGFTDSAVGEFLGYEKDSVEFYENLEKNETAVKPYDEKVDEMLENGDLEEDELKFLELVFYVPVPDREHIMDALTTGRDRWEILSSSETGKKYLELLEQQL